MKDKMNNFNNKRYDKGSTERFGYEWNSYDNIVEDYEKQFLKWAFPLKKSDFNNKRVLDAGCGTGRNSYWPLNYGAREVVAFDFDKRTVNAAKRNLSNFKNAKVLYNSIYSIPYQDYFDISFSIGVIHHLEKPREAIKSLVKATKKNGKVLIWVYGYEGNEFYLKFINPLRKYITSKLPLPIVHLLTYFLSIPFYFYLKFFKQKREYFKQLSKFEFWHIHSISFDQLIPKIANYWKKEQAIKLFQEQGLTDIQIFPVNGISWTVIGTKK